MRIKLFWWIVDKVAHIPEGQIMPHWLIGLRWVMFPLETYLLKNRFFNYDPRRDIFVIYGVRYSGQLFRAFAKNGISIGRYFEILNRESDGTITIKAYEKAAE